MRRACLLAALDAHRTDLDDAGARADARRLEVDDRPDSLCEQRARGWREPDETHAAVVVPDEPRIVLEDLLQDAPRELPRNVREREQRPRRSLRSQRLAARLDQRREPVGCPQLELDRRGAGPTGRWHPACMRTYVRMTPDATSRSFQGASQ